VVLLQDVKVAQMTSVMSAVKEATLLETADIEDEEVLIVVDLEEVTVLAEEEADLVLEAQEREGLDLEAEADLAREIDSQAACIVNGDGTVVDNKRPSDLPLSSVPSSKDGTPEESSTIESSWTMDPKILQEPHIRDGTSVNMEEANELERPGSPISLKLKRRSPNPSTLPVNPPALKVTSPTTTSRSYSYFGSKQPPPPVDPLKILSEMNGTLTRRRTHMNLNLSANTPLSHDSQFSPSIPTVRRRERATSHPDIYQLCQSWVQTGPANEPVRIEANHSLAHGTES